MLRLAKLGSVVINAHNDHLSLESEGHVDLSSRAQWPEDALAHHDGLRTAIEVEQCLEAGFAESHEGQIVIRYDLFPAIRRAGFMITSCWTEWSPLLLKIDRLNDIGRPAFQYRYSFLHVGRQVPFNRVGYFGTMPGSSKSYRLDDQTFSLVHEMNRFNALPADHKSRSESWLAFSKVKECAIDVGARLDSYLLANDVIVPQMVNLEVHNWPDGSISFAPQVPGMEGEGLKRAFFQHPKAQDFYSVDGPNKSRVRVVFDERQTEVLDRMKDVHRFRGENKARVLKDPESVFEGLLDVVEVRYGPRVTGIGALQNPTIASISRGRSVLDGGSPGGNEAERPSNAVQTETSDGSPVRVDLSSPTSKQDFIAAARHAIDSGQPTFKFGGQDLRVDDIVSNYVADSGNRRGEGSSQSGSDAADAYLIPYQDEDELKPWDIANALEAQKATEVTMGHIVPSSLRSDVILQAHQLEGIEWLQTCHRLRPARRGSLLADDMGLGKTLQILSYLAWCIEHDRDLGLSNEVAPWRPILVVLPLILLESGTWEQEISTRFGKGIFDPVLVLHGAKIKELRRATETGRETVLGRPLISAEHFTNHRIVLTNYQTVVNYQHSFAQLIPGTQRSLWSVLVTDEAQEYKSPSTKVSHALKTLHPDIHIACTGTPVENRLLDLWNLIDTVQPALLGTSKDFSAKYEKATEDPDGRLIDLKKSLLFGQGNSFVLRRNKSEVLTLPPKTFHPLYAEMTEWEVQTHRELLASVGGGSPIKILGDMVALYQHPSLLRKDVGALDAANLLKESSKLRAVIEKLREIRLRREKVVIFAYRIPMQQILAAVIAAEFGIQADIVNGNTERGVGADAGSLGSQQSRRTRTEILDRFRHSVGFNVILLSPFVASIGLTITEANHVIHYGRWWNPAVEAQATDRVYRIGQNKPVYVHLPILRDSTGTLGKSFDENLHELIEQKLAQAKNFLSPLPEEAHMAQELFGKLKEEWTPDDLLEPISAESIDNMPHHLFEALVACVLEAEGHKTILTARSNDHGADALGFREGELWLVQAKHTKKDGFVGSIAMADLMAAAMSYSAPLSYSVHLLAVTNGNFSEDTRSEAARNGIKLLDRHRLMTQVRSSSITMGMVYARENDRCLSFNDGIKAAKRWFEG
jgi:HJR/Mrr/RecB family endonuclease